MAELKPAYLIHGDDHGRIAERRGKLIELAQGSSGEAGLQILSAGSSQPDELAAAMNSITFAVGRRFIVVDDTQRWKAAELKPLLTALADPLPDLTVAFFAQEDGRSKVSDKLIKAVVAAGGDVSSEVAIKPWQLPQWAVKAAAGYGLELELDAARILVERAAGRQQRILRELEKLVLVVAAGERIDVELLERYQSGDIERKVWTLADDLLSGNLQKTLKTWLGLQEQGENPAALVPLLANRLRLALETARRLDAGESVTDLKRGLRMPPKAAERFLRDLSRVDHRQLADAVKRLAAVELGSRGGGERAAINGEQMRPYESDPQAGLVRMILAIGRG